MGCFHKFLDGAGSMGDGYHCVKCGYSKYPEVLPGLAIYQALGRIIHQDHTYGYRHEYPFAVRFPSTITFQTDWNTWSHYFDRKGVLRSRIYSGNDLPPDLKVQAKEANKGTTGSRGFL